jgi:cell division protein FtsQ
MSNAESAYGGAKSAYGGDESAYGGAALRGEAPGERRAAGRWVRPLLAALLAASGLVLLVRFVGEPLTIIRHVTVHSDVALSDEEVLSLSGIQSGDHWYSVSEPAIEKRLEASPVVRRAQVQRVFPDTVRVTLWGRQPAALVLAFQAGRTVPVLVDEAGVVYRVGATGADLDLPVVSGLSAGDVALGASLPQSARALFADLRALRDRAPSLYALVSEVRIAPPAEAARAPQAAEGESPAGVRAASPQDLELLVYLTSARVPIRTRGTLDESLVKYAIMVIDLLSRQGVLRDIQELDFRSGDVVYKRGGRAAAPDPAASAGDTANAVTTNVTAGAAAAGTGDGAEGGVRPVMTVEGGMSR